MRLIFVHILISISILLVRCRDYQYYADYKTDSGLYELRWSLDSIMKIIEIQFCKGIPRTLPSPTWIGIGFSDRGELENSDIFAVNLNQIQALDLHTDNNGKIQHDATDNYILEELSRSDGKLCFSIKREINTCDKSDYTIDRGTTNMFLFTSNFKKNNIKGMDFSFFNPFLISLQLIRSTMPVGDVPPSTATMEIKVKEVEIPNEKTTYWCKVVKLPKLLHKHHIIKFEAVISDDSEGIIHHMELFHCISPPSQSMSTYDAPCNAESKPMGLTMCRKVIAAWAMGAKAFVYPQNVGNPIGGPHFTNYAILEIHYNNQDQKIGIIDNSGLRLFYTKDLRKFDAGIIELGLEYTDKNSIPPQQESFTLSGYCLSDCTRTALPPNGIFVFGSQLHTHLTGIQVETRHFRQGRELKPLNKDEHYQPHYQEIRLLPHITNILPGDELITTCTYKTTNRTEMTLGGIGILDEMCLNYIFYYPRLDLELCKSSISDNALELFLGKDLNGLKQTFNQIQWSEKNSKTLERFYKEAPIHQSCNMSDSKSYRGNWDGSMPPLPVPKIPNLEIAKYECLAKQLIKSFI